MAIQDVDDLIRQLRQHPEWRDALRRELLTEELLSLPQIVRDLIAQVGELTEAQRQTQAQVSELAEDLRQTQAQLSELVVELRKLAEAQRRTGDRVGGIEGRLLERDYFDKAYTYFNDLLRKIQVLPWSEVAELLDQAEGRISGKERKQVMEADLILRGRRLADKIETYLLGDVSVGIGLEDVHRAAQRARILARATGGR